MKIKVCGLFRTQDAEYINNLLPDFAGFVFYPKSHRFTDDDTAFKLRQMINPIVKTVGVFVDDDMEHIELLYKKGVIDIIQLHGHENEDYINKLRQRLPNAEIWQAFVIRDEQDLIKAKNSSADRVLLDNGYGTGKCFDWSLIKDFNREFILAGGITPENITDAAENFSPYAIDVSSGVETEKIKDKEKIKAVITAIKGFRSEKNV